MELTTKCLKTRCRISVSRQEDNVNSNYDNSVTLLLHGLFSVKQLIMYVVQQDYRMLYSQQVKFTDDRGHQSTYT